MVRVAYQKVKTCFDATGEFPTSSKGLVCCYDRKPFKTKPIPVVSDFDPSNNTYHVYKVACSKACSKGYVIKNSGDSITWRRSLLMYQHRLLVALGLHPEGQPIPMAHSLEALESMPIHKWRIPDDATVVPIVDVLPKLVPHRVMLRVPVSEKEAADADAMMEVEAVMPTNAPGPLEEERARFQAVELLGDLSTNNLRRPPDEECIDTNEKLRQAYPDLDLISDDPGPFVKWKNKAEAEGTLPTDEECRKIREQQRLERSRKRKRTKAAVARDLEDDD